MNKDSRQLDSMPEKIRSMFRNSVESFLNDSKPDMSKDWNYKINDDAGLVYILSYFHTPSNKSDYIGYMIITRITSYDMEKKKILPSEEDKIIVFKFTTLDELCRKNQKNLQDGIK